jgi:16S rRNA (guanine527-N7)-methyltransferase
VFHVKHEGWTPEQLSPAQLRSIDSYEGLLAEHAVPRGMVAVSDAGHLRERHVLDSLRAVPHILAGPLAVLDLGSGAGLPGIPVAIARPDLTVALAEPRQARAAFLELVVERLRLGNVTVLPRPGEELTIEPVAVVLARGFRGPSKTWIAARDLLSPRGELIYWGGTTFRDDQLPADARVVAIGPPALESGGPIVIMTRQ